MSLNSYAGQLGQPIRYAETPKHLRYTRPKWKAVGVRLRVTRGTKEKDKNGFLQYEVCTQYKKGEKE